MTVRVTFNDQHGNLVVEEFGDGEFFHLCAAATRQYKFERERAGNYPITARRMHDRCKRIMDKLR